MAETLLQVVTTVAAPEDADKLASAVLDARLAACIQISGPIESRYWWNGRIETDREWVLLFKTHKDCYAKLEKLLLEQHPYDEPEVVATLAAKVSPGYQKWLNAAVK